MAEVKLLRGLTLTVEQTLVTETCCNCGLLFAMTKDFKDEKLAERNNHNRRTFYCPNGHAQWYIGETEEQKLKRERDQLKHDNEWYSRRNNELRQEAKRERNRANGYKGHATKITKRAKAGVCPCCNRSFENLRRHMASKHPTFTPMELEDHAPEGATVQ